MNMGGGWPTLGGQRMKIEEWPNFITVKILQLEAQAKTLAAQAEVLTAQAECVRDEITGRTTTKAEPQALRAEFERLLCQRGAGSPADRGRRACGLPPMTGQLDR